LSKAFGEATPLIAYLFHGHHREKYFGAWDFISTVRIVGADHSEVELAVINAAIQYSELFGTLPRLLDMDESALFLEEEEEEEKHGPDLIVQPPPTRDLEAIRFFYFGISQTDDAAACIYFYRVLEYYSFLTNKKQMAQLRNDTSISEDDFARQVLQLVTKDEKGPFFKLIHTLANQELLEKAATAGVIKSANPQLLADEIYALRNSIVHGKYSYGYVLQSSSVIAEDGALPHWRTILRVLARLAMDNLGNKLI
jgi:hypothetical protein